MKDNFETGYFTCMVIIIFSLILLYVAETLIKSPKKIEPQIELTTDGKVIDTLYVYKQE